MAEEEVEIRFVIEALDGVYCTYNYNVQGDSIRFLEGNEEHFIELSNILKVSKEVVTITDITKDVTKDVKAALV